MSPRESSKPDRGECETPRPLTGTYAYLLIYLLGGSVRWLNLDLYFKYLYTVKRRAGRRQVSPTLTLIPPGLAFFSISQHKSILSMLPKANNLPIADPSRQGVSLTELKQRSRRRSRRSKAGCLECDRAGFVALFLYLRLRPSRF